MHSSLKKTGTLAACGLATCLVARKLFGPQPYSFIGKNVLITGGARGLGLELARIWAREGARVAICSRNEGEISAALDELRQSGGSVYGEVCDVTDRSQVQAVLGRVRERWGILDVLVNNAGIIQTGPVECMTIEDFEKAMATHFWGPLYAIDAVLPQMRARGSGRIVNISSIGGRIAVPHLVPYCASKFALAGLSEGLSAELRCYGIRVTTVCPGLMRTGSPRHAEFKGRHRAEYAWFSISASMPVAATDSTLAARRIVEACRRGDAEVSTSWPAAIVMRGHALARELGAALLDGFNRLLPSADGAGTASHKGWQSGSEWSPSWLTALNEKAAARNHEHLATPPRETS